MHEEFQIIMPGEPKTQTYDALTHDFATAHGPRKAFTEFFEHLPEPLIEVPGAQTMVVKL
jgi:hypothetical protein